MKNRILILAMAVAMVFCMISCGNASKGSDEFKLTVENVDNYIESLGDYSSMKSDLSDICESSKSVSDDAVDMYSVLFFEEEAAAIDSWVARPYDKVVVDYTGRVNGRKFEGGSNTDKLITIGSHSLLEGFEEGMIGLKEGDRVTLKLSFPENYSQDVSLAGKECEFEVTVKKVIPALDDESVKALDIPDCDNVNDFKLLTYDALVRYGEKQYVDYVVNSYFLDTLIDNDMVTFKEFDDLLLSYSESILRDKYAENAKRYAILPKEYLEYRFENLEEEIIRTAKKEVILTKIAKEENLMALETLASDDYRTKLLDSVYSYLVDYINN